MIRFIDLGRQIDADDQEESPRFAFWNTCMGEFEEFNSSQTWESREEFIDDFKSEEGGPLLTPQDYTRLARRLALIPPSWPACPAQPEPASSQGRQSDLQDSWLAAYLRPVDRETLDRLARAVLGRSAPAGGPKAEQAGPEVGREEGGPQAGGGGVESWQGVVKEMDRQNVKRARGADRCAWPGCREPSLCLCGNFGGAPVCGRHFQIINATNTPREEATQETPGRKEREQQAQEFFGAAKEYARNLAERSEQMFDPARLRSEPPAGSKIHCVFIDDLQAGDPVATTPSQKPRTFLLLTQDEAVVLYDILMSIGGDPERSPRRHAATLLHKLAKKLGGDPRPDRKALPKDGRDLYYLNDLPGPIPHRSGLACLQDQLEELARRVAALEAGEEKVGSW
jgi:hypothetical protein